MPECQNPLDSPVTLSRKSREDLFLLRQEFNTTGIMQARQVLLFIHLSPWGCLEKPHSKTSSLSRYRNTHKFHLLSSYPLPAAPCALLGRHTSVPATHSPGDRHPSLSPARMPASWSSHYWRFLLILKQTLLCASTSKWQNTVCLQFLLNWYPRNSIQWWGGCTDEEKIWLWKQLAIYR